MIETRECKQVIKVADSLMGLEHYNPGLKYYLILEENIGNENVW